ncbi:MAG: hypothetical protein LBH90_07065 [Tannerella sp.]|jgi:hypothetical protein|nr:hypothetical protein [Tannerella sp.]
MKLLILLIIFFSLYLIYRLSFPRQTENRLDSETPPPKQPDNYEEVVKNRFVLPVSSNSKQDADTRKESDKQEENAPIFAAENEKKDVVIPLEGLPEIFDKDVNPENLDIEPDASETSNDSELDADEEAEEIRQSTGKIERYAEGFTYDELATVIRNTDKPETMTKAAVETLRDFSKTDMFEKLVSGDTGRAARIASILDRSEQSLASQDGEVAENDNEYKDFDIMEFLS